MVSSVRQAVQQQVAAASKTDIAKTGFVQAVQNQGVLVAGKVTKAKVAEYKFPYQPNELIGVFGDRKQYRVTMPSFESFSTHYSKDGFNPMSNMDPANRLDPKDPVKQRQLTWMHINVNGETVYTKIGSQPTKQQVIETLTRAFRDKDSFEFYGHDSEKDKKNIKNLELPVGQKADGSGQHIKGDKANYDANYHQFVYRGFIRKLGKDVAARGGVSFNSINISNLRNDQLSYTPDNYIDNLNYLVNDLINRNVLTKGGKLSIKMASGSKEPTFKIDTYPNNLTEIGYLAQASQASNIEIKLKFYDEHRDDLREYVFKPNETAWLNGKQIVTSPFTRDQKRK
jgi:hypothetical protein